MKRKCGKSKQQLSLWGRQRRQDVGIVPATLLLVLALTSCNPRVVTEMLTNEWPATSPDSVYVFDKTDVIPSESQEIGKIKVVDTGFTTNGSFNTVMQRAINATAAKGGNGLVITEHRYPDVRSTIHRIWGTMLRIPDSAVIGKASPDSMEYSALRQILPEEEYAEFMEYKATKRYYEQEQKQIEEQMKQQQELIRLMPRNVIRISAGPTLMTSKFLIGNHQYKSRLGADICVDYDHVWKSGFGFGINYLHHYTSFDEGVKLRVNYIGPSLVLAYTRTKSFRCDLAWGLGYSRYSESFEGNSVSQNRLGVTMRIGGEWKVAKHLALGVQFNVLSVGLEKPEGIELEKDEFYGIQHVGLQGGLRYYF